MGTALQGLQLCGSREKVQHFTEGVNYRISHMPHFLSPITAKAQNVPELKRNHSKIKSVAKSETPPTWETHHAHSGPWGHVSKAPKVSCGAGLGKRNSPGNRTKGLNQGHHRRSGMLGCPAKGWRPIQAFLKPET